MQPNNKSLKKYAIALAIAAVMLFELFGTRTFARSIQDRVALVVEKYNGKHEVKNMIFVGDSRVEGMQWLSGRYHYICETSKGCDWLVGSAEQRISEMKATLPESEVIICLGVNDVANIGRYIEEYNKLKGIYGESIWFMSVTPVEDDRCANNGYMVNNAMIESFNAQLKNGVGRKFIDCYSYLRETGFETQDGLHYTADTYMKIEDFIKKAIEESA